MNINIMLENSPLNAGLGHFLEAAFRGIKIKMPDAPSSSIFSARVHEVVRSEKKICEKGSKVPSAGEHKDSYYYYYRGFI